MSGTDWLALPYWPKMWPQPKGTAYGTRGRGTAFAPRDPDALAELTAAVDDLPDDLPCAGGEAISEDPEVQEQCAQDLCPGCPVRDLCYEAGRREAFGVWGARIRTPPAIRHRRAA